MLFQDDLSPKDFLFNPFIGCSFRERIRDLADKIFCRPIYRISYHKKFSSLSYPVDLTLPERGLSTLARRNLVNKYVPINNSRILVLGCGTGLDFGTWFKFKPKEIVGVDLLNFSNCWKQIKNYVTKNGLNTQLSFYQIDVSEIDQFKLGEFDIICSDAVFEHCRDLKTVLRTLHRHLHKDGIIYASYGPLWYCWAGDHFSGRGGIEAGYNHLLLDDNEYLKFINKYRGDINYELQNGGGGLFVELDLFSKLSGNEYIELYRQNNFQLEEMITEFSNEAQKSISSSDIRDKLLNKFPNFTIDDFLLKTHIAILSKK